LSTSESWRNPRPTPNLDEIGRRVPRKSFAPDWLRAWWPAIVWACIIFTASTDAFSADHTGSFFYRILRALDPSISEAQLHLIHLFIRKSAHFTEYFIFYLVLFRGIRRTHSGSSSTASCATALLCRPVALATPALPRLVPDEA
jgi:hypothetical protein